MRRGGSQITRIYVPDAPAPGAVLALPGPAAHHLSRVLRAETGDAVVVFHGGSEFAATITRIDKNTVIVKTAAGVAVSRESPLACTLAQAVSSGERMDVTLQKAVELGVRAVQPLFSERSIVRLDSQRSEKRVAHWRQILVSACEQCGRNDIPELAAPLAYTEWLGELAPAAEGEARLLMSPRASSRLADLPRPGSVLLLAGPEGGYSNVETGLAQRFGFAAVRLGPRVLRTETAALAALAAMNALWGDF